MTAANGHQLWFRTSKFEILQGEDEKTNPHCYGNQLAEWLRNKLLAEGYQVEAVIPEDWGWCVMCSRKPFSLWVGCSNVRNFITTKPTDPIPKGSDVVWTCYVVAEQSLIGRIFKQADTRPSVQKLFEQVSTLLAKEADVKFVEQP